MGGSFFFFFKRYDSMIIFNPDYFDVAPRDIILLSPFFIASLILNRSLFDIY